MPREYRRLFIDLVYWERLKGPPSFFQPRSQPSDMDYAATSSSSSFPNAQPFFGIVENTVHALRLVQAARQGVIPRIVRRLNDSERRKMITSGAVFVFSVEESGIKRWTDGLLWSPSRIVGNFLVGSHRSLIPGS